MANCLHFRMYYRVTKNILDTGSPHMKCISACRDLDMSNDAFRAITGLAPGKVRVSFSFYAVPTTVLLAKHVLTEFQLAWKRCTGHVVHGMRFGTQKAVACCLSLQRCPGNGPNARHTLTRAAPTSSSPLRKAARATSGGRHSTLPTLPSHSGLCPSTAGA
jgi:hypothetical protein